MTEGCKSSWFFLQYEEFGWLTK